MLEPIANIKILLIELSCLPINCFHRVIVKRSWCQQFNISVGDIITSLLPTMWPFLNLFQICWPQSRHSKTFKYQIFIFADFFHGYIDMAGAL